MDDTRISLIIPAYNEERYLDRCLKSVSKQTLRPLEVLVIDNNSTDKTAEIAAKYDFVTIIKETQQGLVYARTTGFDRARGDLLVRIDADGRLPADWLKTVAAAATKWPGVAAFTGRGKFYDTPWPRFLGAVQVLTYQLLQWPAMRSPTLWGANTVLRKEAWEHVKYHCHRRNDIDEDIDLTLQLRQQGYTIRFVPQLHSEMSLRRDQTDPLAVARYLSTWPRDYAVNDRPFAAVYIVLLTVCTCIVAACGWVVEQLWRKLRPKLGR